MTLPPGQTAAQGWPVFSHAEVPRLDPAAWELRVFGCVERELRFDWNEVLRLPRERRRIDLHCVTFGSALDLEWDGVPVAGLLDQAGAARARFGLAHGYDAGFSTNMPIEHLREGLLALFCNGQPLTPEHGAPLRLVVPGLYAWKSAKWLRGLELLEEDRMGYWESRGSHARGDVWKGER